MMFVHTMYSVQKFMYRELYIYSQSHIYLSRKLLLYSKPHFARFMFSEVLDGEAEVMKVFSGLQ